MSQPTELRMGDDVIQLADVVSFLQGPRCGGNAGHYAIVGLRGGHQVRGYLNHKDIAALYRQLDHEVPEHYDVGE